LITALPIGPLAVGVDVSAVERIAKLQARRPEFAAKFFSPEEIAYCKGRPERLAARWAAKEAVRKVFGSQGWRIPTYPSVAVRRRAGGAPELLVEGRLVPGLELSLTHDAGIAIAVATLDRRAGWEAALVAHLPEELVLPARPADGHKGTFGTVLMVAGSPAFQGAATLACLGALRGGAGKVKMVVDRVGAGAGLPPEVIRVPVAVTEDSYSEASAATLEGELHSAEAVVCGPGLGESEPLLGFLLTVVGHMAGRGQQLVLDADGLNAVARWDQLRQAVPPGLVVTPHPLEASRLLGTTVGEIQSDREQAATELARSMKAVVVLKGSGTVVTNGDGRMYTDSHATSALASGGTGDVLAGLIGALIAQGLPPFEAARAGVFLHGESGAQLGIRRGRAGILASEVADALVEVQEAVRLGLEGRGRR
jgi:NAD(P)H-hydrate epimerase